MLLRENVGREDSECRERRYAVRERRQHTDSAKNQRTLNGAHFWLVLVAHLYDGVTQKSDN